MFTFLASPAAREIMLAGQFSSKCIVKLLKIAGTNEDHVGGPLGHCFNFIFFKACNVYLSWSRQDWWGSL